MLKLLIFLVPFTYSSKQNAQDVVAKCSTKKLKLPYEEGIKAVPKINLWPTRSQEVYIPQFNIDSALKPKLKSLLT